MSFSFIPQKINGLYEVLPRIYSDQRGSFFECYSEEAFFSAGLTMKFVQDNQSFSKKNVVRGLHFQKNHPQGKLVRCISGKIYDIAVDMRKGSETYLQWQGLELDSSRRNMFYIPEGFAHGFCVLSDSAEIHYKCSNFYYPNDEGGLMWDDPVLGIDWERVLPQIKINAVLSEKDKHYTYLKRTNRD